MEKPKRPLSSFNLFYRYKRAVILEMTSGITTTKEDVLKILSATVGLEGDDDAVLQQSSQQQPPPAGPTNEINIRRRNKVRDALNGKILPQNNGRRRHRKSANSLGISFSELGKLMTTCWKDVDPYGKDIFEELSEEGRQIYRDQMEEYNKVKPQKDIMPTAKPKPTKPKAPPSGVSQNDKKLISANMVSMQKGMTARGKNIINESAAAAGFPSAFLQRHGGVGATFPPTLNDGSNWEGVGNPKLAKLMPLHRGIPPTLHRGIPPSYPPPPPVAVAPQQFGGHQIPPSAAYAMAAQNAVKDTAAFRTAFPRITPSLLPPTTHHHHHQIPPQYMSHYHNIATTHHPQIHHNTITSNIISYHQLVASKNVPPRMMHPFDDNNKRMHESIISRNEEHGMLEARAVPRTTSVAAAAPPPPSAKINNMDVLAAAAGLAGAEEPTSSKTTEEEDDDEERELMEKLERLREKKRRGGGVVQGGGGGDHLPIKKRFKM